MRFEFFPVRFEFVARDILRFPRGKAGNTLRGALGMISRRLDAVRYRQIFEPVFPGGTGPSGLADAPRSFVFRTRHLDGCTVSPGEAFYVDLNLFSLDRDLQSSLIRMFGALAREGMGPDRGKAELTRTVMPPCPVSLNLEPLASASSAITVEFLSPTELKHDGALAPQPEFPILFARIRDRVSTLRALYGPGSLDIDFAASSRRAASIVMTRCQIDRVETIRRSTRTGQSHSIGGFVGSADYEGDLAEFLPYLEAARYTGVGRHAVWGNGELAIPGTIFPGQDLYREEPLP